MNNPDLTNIKRYQELLTKMFAVYGRKTTDGDFFSTGYAEDGMAFARSVLGERFDRFKCISRKPLCISDRHDDELRKTLLEIAHLCMRIYLATEDMTGGIDI